MLLGYPLFICSPSCSSNFPVGWKLKYSSTCIPTVCLWIQYFTTDQSDQKWIQWASNMSVYWTWLEGCFNYFLTWGFSTHSLPGCIESPSSQLGSWEEKMLILSTLLSAQQLQQINPLKQCFSKWRLKPFASGHWGGGSESWGEHKKKKKTIEKNEQLGSCCWSGMLCPCLAVLKVWIIWMRLICLCTDSVEERSPGGSFHVGIL